MLNLFLVGRAHGRLFVAQLFRFCCSAVALVFESTHTINKLIGDKCTLNKNGLHVLQLMIYYEVLLRKPLSYSFSYQYYSFLIDLVGAPSDIRNFWVSFDYIERRYCLFVLQNYNFLKSFNLLSLK